MSTSSSLDAEAYRLLRTDLYGYLDEAEFLAAKYAPWSEEDSASARALIPDLVTVIRGVIVLHDPSEKAPPRSCPTCHTDWPCTAFHTIHRLVKDPDGEFVALMRRVER